MLLLFTADSLLGIQKRQEGQTTCPVVSVLILERGALQVNATMSSAPRSSLIFSSLEEI